MKNLKPLFRSLAVFLALICCAMQFAAAQSSQTIRDYIQKYKNIAIEEMIRTGVPAAITLAQGIHETSAGTSDLVIKSNNHFGIKCKSEWTGATVYHDDDARGECFRKYEDPSQSYKDHSDFLKTRAYYASLFDLDPTDYKAWAYGLKKAGYATNPKYPQILIKLIEDYDLESFTQIALNVPKEQGSNMQYAGINNTATIQEVKPLAAVYQPPVVVTPSYPSGVFRINETPVIFVSKGTSFLKLAIDHNLSLARLYEFNDLPSQEVSTEDQLIFLQRKRKKGGVEFHIVLEGEGIRLIAQREGIRLEDLCEYNSIKPETKVAVGERLNLQNKAATMPKLATTFKTEATPVNSRQLSQPSEENIDSYILHKVQPKETAYAIAKKYFVSVEELLIWNEMGSPALKEGQELKILKKETDGGY